jgi:hypothetical protein
LRRANAERDRAKRAVRRGVAVAARDRHSRLRETELGADHVHDALTVVIKTGEADAEVAHVALERRQHVLGHHVEKWPLPVLRRDDVIGRRKGAVRPRHLPAARTQLVECLRRRHLMHEVQADEKLRLPSRQLSHGVEVPHLLQECFAHR